MKKLENILCEQSAKVRQIFFFFCLRNPPPPPSLIVSQELNTLLPFRNEKVETVVVDDAPPILLKLIHLAMRIIINRKLLKEKKSETYFGKRERGGVLFHMTLVSAMLKWQYKMAVKVFSVN